MSGGSFATSADRRIGDSAAGPLGASRSHIDTSGHEHNDDAVANGPRHRVAGLVCLALSFVGVGAVMIYIGPTKVLRFFLLLVPKKPGWGWYIGMGIFTALSIVMLMPIWPPMCMAAGLIFGLTWGMLLNFVSIMTAAIISILLGRTFLRDWLRTKLEEGEYPSTKRIFRVLENEENTLKFQVLFRFLFIPMFIRNYMPSTLEVPLWKLIVGSIPHSIWISFLFASLGATFKDIAMLIRDGEEVSSKDMKWQQLATMILSFIVALLLGWYAHRKYMEQVAKEEETRPLETPAVAGSGGSSRYGAVTA